MDILNTLAVMEYTEDVRVLYACESGSRAWGFASRDSDYDVRFIYIHRPEWYFSIGRRRDVIELPIMGNLDINGWDLRKALRLLRASNPPLMEWLASHIVYLDRYGIAQQMRNIIGEHYSRSTCSYHYLHMASGNYHKYLQRNEVWIKKYLYVLRPLLTVMWIEQHVSARIIPVNFNVIVEQVAISAQVKDDIEELIKSKLAGAELRSGPRIASLDQFIKTELEQRHNRIYSNSADAVPVQVFDSVFLSAIKCSSSRFSRD